MALASSDVPWPLDGFRVDDGAGVGCRSEIR